MLSIACVAWGSLIWKPAHHPGAPLEAQGVRAGLVDDGGSWRVDGPVLPLELARSAASSAPEQLYPSWVILPGAPASRSLWAPLDLPEDVDGDVDRALLVATRALAVREGADASRIGRWPVAGRRYPEDETVAAWAAARGLDGVVWTALPPRWLDADRAPTLDEVLALVRGLGAASYAEDYIRRTPPQVTSPYRAAIERELGWR